MGKKCPRCKSTNTSSYEPDRMHCSDCGHAWKPYKHSGKKMKVVGDGILTTRKRIMPGAKTETIGDGFIIGKKRVKKTRRRKNILGF